MQTRDKIARIEIETSDDGDQWYVVYNRTGKPVLWTQDRQQAKLKLAECM